MRFRRTPARLPEPLEGWGLDRDENHGRCIVCGALATRKTRRYSAKLLGRESRRVYPTVPFCYEHALVTRAAMSLGKPVLLPNWMVEDGEG
jgi:hypothetical protein